MSPITADTHVADLVLEQPTRARVFERFGIDYCCGGKPQSKVSAPEPFSRYLPSSRRCRSSWDSQIT